MKYFNHKTAASFDQASDLLKQTGNNVLIAGGTDLVGVLKDEIFSGYPDTVIDLKRIPDADDIELKDGVMNIGALTKLKDIVESRDIQEKLPILSQAAKSVATPLIRNTATLGGNICQDVRCWYYRYPQEGGGRLDCYRKGGDVCYAIQGDNRYHSIFGGMKTHPTPCTRGCPAGTDIPGYMERIRKNDNTGAAHIIMKVNPMPMITSRVCAHFCETACNRHLNDKSVAIRNVERFIGDYIMENAGEFYQAPEKENGKSVAVVGSGPSGLAAAYYLRRAGNAVTIYDKKDKAGGVMTYGIPAYRLPKAIVQNLIKALEGMGIRFALNTDVGSDLKPADIEKKFDSVYYATGAWKRPFIGLDSEEMTIFGLDFLVEVNQWMSNKVGDEVLVTGGGNVAIDVAVTAKRLGAKKVIMACLESENEMPASKEEIDRAREEGVIIMPSRGPFKILEEDGRVKGMVLKRCVSVWDESGVFAPKYDENEKSTVHAGSILMAVGQQVDLSFLDEKYQLKIKRGLIDVSDETQMTSRPGVFAGGDATTGPATVIAAVVSGRAAAVGINHYLGVSKFKNAESKSEKKEKLITLDPVGIREKTAARLPELPKERRSLNKEDSSSLTVDEAVKEAARCLNCGCYAINPSDITPVLVALDADIQTNFRAMSAEKFCLQSLRVSDILQPGEIMKGVSIPITEGVQMHYDKFRLRDAVDFAILSVAAVYRIEKDFIKNARLVFGGVAPVPIRATEVEGYLEGKKITESLAQEASRLAVTGAIPLEMNSYKVTELKVMIERSILNLLQ